MLRADVDKNQLGRQVILPATHIGSPRDMHAKFQDGMAVCRQYGKIDLFLTMTTNPNWREIKESLSQGQKPEDRPDLIARIFKLKLDSLEKELYKDGIFGARIAHMRVIEFQKRGLPHAHILIILHEKDRISSIEQVDKIVVAEIPPHHETIFDNDPDIQLKKREQVKRLRELVLGNMVHGPCGKDKNNAPCMYN